MSGPPARRCTDGFELDDPGNTMLIARLLSSPAGLPAPRPLSDGDVAARAGRVDGATLDDFDALCAHLATMHPSRFLALIEGVTAMFFDRRPGGSLGAKLDTIFSADMLAGGHRKKFLRAMSRLVG